MMTTNRIANVSLLRRALFSTAASGAASVAAASAVSDPLDYRGVYKSPTMVTKKGLDLLRDPLTNKGTAFPIAERDALGLRGLLPPVVKSLEITPNDKGNILSLLYNWTEDDVRIIVCTDGSRVLGLGDLGINGMAISVGKLALYVAAGGIRPDVTLPIVIDVGTNNERLLKDPDYLGIRKRRVDEQTYYELMDEFMWSVRQRWPKAMLQFEDFSNAHAYPLLHKYRFSYRCFNDDIQGTGAVAVAGLYCALRQLGLPASELKDQRIVCVGAGSAGLGVCNSIVTAMMSEGATHEHATSRFWLVDSDGLLSASRKTLTPAQRRLSRSDAAEGISLLDTVSIAKPTILLGLSGVGNMFTEQVVRTMHRLSPNGQRPILFPLSNPTLNAECSATDAFEWTDGQAIFSSGSPFAPVEYKGKLLHPSQGNNMFIFPGVGLGVALCGARRVSVEMFAVAAKTLASCVDGDDFAHGKVYPSVQKIRAVSHAIACAVIRCAQTTGLATIEKPEDRATIEDWVAAKMWQPDYGAIIYKKEADWMFNE